MGTCYSKSGHEAALPDKSKLPRDKKKRSSRNGHNGSLRKPRLVIEDCDSIQKDVSDTVYTEDSHFIQGTDVDNCINKSQQTSLEKLVKDFNNKESDDESENTGRFEVTDQDDCLIIDSALNCRDADLNDKDVQNNLNERLKQLDASVRDGKVSTSDSGIVMETCRGCDKQNCDLKDSHSRDFETSADSVDSDNVPLTAESTHTKVVNQSDCTCSKSVKGARGHVTHTDHSSNGECQGHYFSRSFVNTSSESLLKSSLKQKGTCNNIRRRKKRLSWKSADSLDWLDSMTICLDRTKSVCSSILGDDISLLNAPLATFDSDFALGSSHDFSKRLGDNMENNVQYSSDTFQFQFDFSGLEGNNRQSVGSIDRISESNNTTESSTDLDKIQLAIRHLSVGTPTEHR